MKKVYSGSEIKEILSERLGVPDNIYQASVLFYNEIIKYLGNNKDLKINNKINFLINGDFKISDFIFNESSIEIVVDYSAMYNKDLTIDFIGNKSKTSVVDNFKLNTFDYSPENNKTTFVFNYDINYTVKCVHVLKYFLNNKEQIITSLTHELKHKFDDFKKPTNSLIKQAEYDSYNYDSKIQPIDFLIYGMYCTSDTEKFVKNSEFYSELENSGIKKEDFKQFLLNSKIYKTYKFFSTLTLQMTIDNIKGNYMNEVDKLLFSTNNYNENMTVDEKIDLVFKITYLGVSNLKLTYLNSKLSSPTIGIVKSYLTNDEFYQKQLLKIKNNTHINFFNSKLNEINSTSTSVLKRLTKLYDILKEENTFWPVTDTVKPVEWIN